MSQVQEAHRRAPLVRLRKKMKNELVLAARNFIDQPENTPLYYYTLLADVFHKEIVTPARALRDEPSRGFVDQIIDDAEAWIRELEAVSRLRREQAESLKPTVAEAAHKLVPRSFAAEAEDESDVVAMQGFIAIIFPQWKRFVITGINTQQDPAEQHESRASSIETRKLLANRIIEELSSFKAPSTWATTPANLEQTPHWRPGMKSPERASFKHWLDNRPIQIPLSRPRKYIPIFARRKWPEKRRIQGNFRFHSRPQPRSMPQLKVQPRTAAMRPSIRTRVVGASPPPQYRRGRDPGFERLAQSVARGVTPAALEAIQRSTVVKSIEVEDSEGVGSESDDDVEESNEEEDDSRDDESDEDGEEVRQASKRPLRPLLPESFQARLAIFLVLFMAWRLPVIWTWPWVLQILDVCLTGSSHSTLYAILAALVLCQYMDLDPANTLLFLVTATFVPLGRYVIVDGLICLSAWAWHHWELEYAIAVKCEKLRWPNAACLFAVCCAIRGCCTYSTSAA